jgi:hypothetical protein
MVKYVIYYEKDQSNHIQSIKDNCIIVKKPHYLPSMPSEKFFKIEVILSFYYSNGQRNIPWDTITSPSYLVFFFN